MRIVVNDIAASSGGAMTVLMELYHYIRMHDTKNEWIFFLSDSYLEETENIKIKLFAEIKKSHIKKLWFDFVRGKHEIIALKPDVVLSLQNIITFGLDIPQITFIHQSIPFQEIKRFSFFRKHERKLAVYQYLIGQIIYLSAKKADGVIVQTEWMKEALKKKTGILEEKIYVCPPVLDDASKYHKDVDFSNNRFFYPAVDLVYKNHSCIYAACDLLRKQGYHNFSVKLTNMTCAPTENLSCAGTLSKEQVLEMYNCSTLLFPSYIESFGLPLAEARAMGTIILASNCSFSREILNGYENAYYFDPFKPEELAGLMRDVINHTLIKRQVEDSCLLPVAQDEKSLIEIIARVLQHAK